MASVQHFASAAHCYDQWPLQNICEAIFGESIWQSFPHTMAEDCMMGPDTSASMEKDNVVTSLTETGKSYFFNWNVWLPAFGP
jgi:hypothetical protein